MIFRIIKESYEHPLIEAVRNDIGTIFNAVLDDYKSKESEAKSASQKEELIKEAIKETSGAEELFTNIAPTIAKSIIKDGSDIKKNKFLKLIAEIKDDSIFAQPDIDDKLSHMLSLYQNNFTRNIDDSFYKKPSLYDRSLDDLRYVANAYAIVSDKILASRYFSDVDILDPSKFLDSRGKVRPKKQVYELIDSWYTRAGKNFSKSDDNSSKHTSMKGLVEYLKSIKSKLVDRSTGISDFVYDIAKKYYSRWGYKSKPDYDETFKEKNSVFLEPIIDEVTNNPKALFTLQTDPEVMAQELFRYWEKIV